MEGKRGRVCGVYMGYHIGWMDVYQGGFKVDDRVDYTVDDRGYS